METNYQELSIKIKNKAQFYDILSKIFYLPNFNSRAITKDYLYKYLPKEPQIFTIKRLGLTQHHFRFNRYCALELLEILNKMLKDKGKPPSGIEANALPNVEWLMNAILYLDNTDPFELLQAKKEEKVEYKLEVSQE